MSTYKIHSLNKGFYKVTRPDGIIHNMSEDKVKKLREDKENKFVEVKVVEAPVVIDPKADDIIGEAGTPEAPKDPKIELMKLNKADLADLATRNGFTDEITNEVTKAMLVEYIVNKD